MGDGERRAPRTLAYAHHAKGVPSGSFSQQLSLFDDVGNPNVSHERRAISRRNPLIDNGISVIFFGCDASVVDLARSQTNRKEILATNDETTAISLIDNTVGSGRTPIVMLGQNIGCNAGYFRDTAQIQKDLIKRLITRHPELKIVVLVEDGSSQSQRNGAADEDAVPKNGDGKQMAEKGRDRCPGENGEKPQMRLAKAIAKLDIESLDPNDDISGLISAGAELWMTKWEIADLGIDLIANGIILGSEQAKDFQPIICEVRDGGVYQVAEAQVASAMETMEKFQKIYNPHMEFTFHYAAMYEAVRQMMVNSPERVFGRRIIDLGCGSGEPMRRYIEGIIGPEYKAGRKIDKIIAEEGSDGALTCQLGRRIRKRTEVLMIDRSVGMLAQARKTFLSPNEENDGVEESQFLKEAGVEMSFLKAEIMDLTAGTLAGRGFMNFDTVLVSMLIHWQPNDMKAKFPAVIVSLMPEDAVLISIEEWPQSVNPSPYISPELMKEIKKGLYPVHPDEYKEILRKCGLEEIMGAEAYVPIDNKHGYLAKAWKKQAR